MRTDTRPSLAKSPMVNMSPTLSPHTVSQSSPVPLRVGLLEGQAVADRGRVRPEQPAGGGGRAVEQKRLDAHVVVEPLQVTHVRRGQCGVEVHVRRAVRGYVEVVRGGERGYPYPLGYAAAAARRHPHAADLHRRRAARGAADPGAVPARRRGTAVQPRLQVTTSTVEKHATAVFRKLGLGGDHGSPGDENARVCGTDVPPAQRPASQELTAMLPGCRT